MRRLNNSFVHGLAVYGGYAWGLPLLGYAGWAVPGLICVYAGWQRRAYLASFLGGVIVAVLAMTAVGVLASQEVDFGVFFMVPFALVVILPVVLAGYGAGKLLAAATRGRASASGAGV